MNNDSGLTFTGRIRSLRCALKGVRVMVASQHNAWIHAAATAAVAGAGLYFGLDRAEWCWVILAVIAAKAKDVAAGAVLITAVGSVAIGLLVFGPHVRDLIRLWR